jgi:hemerythrin
MVELDDIKKIIYHYIDKPNTSPEEAEEISEKLNHVLRYWLVEHIIKSDMKMKGIMDNAT